MTPIDDILAEFKEARKHGQQKYGGADPVGHDLDHKLTDWTRFIRDHLQRACGPDAFVSLDQREHLVKAGGLILSAIWALDVNAGRIPLKGCNAGGFDSREKNAIDLIVTTFGPQYPAEPTPKMIPGPARCDRCGDTFNAPTTGMLMENCPKCGGRLATLDAPECPRHAGTKMTWVDGMQPHHEVKGPHWRCELWVGGGVCGYTIRPLATLCRCGRKTINDGHGDPAPWCCGCHQPTSECACEPLENRNG